MLLIIQFPIVDTRQFIDVNTQLLGYPVWPIPNPDIDFVRYFGAIRRRWKGGLSGWVSESLICEADKALRFREILRYSYREDSEWEDSVVNIPFGIAYRRFYFDGLAVGKFELGVYLNTVEIWNEVPSSEIEALFQYFLRIPVRIPNPQGKPINCSLFEAGKHLASLYLLGSSQTRCSEIQKVSNWWVQSCEPILFLTQDDTYKWEYFNIPFVGRSISLNENIFGSLSHHYIPFDGYTFRLWNYHEKVGGWGENIGTWDPTRQKHFETKTKTQARELRIYLLRLHAERECFKQILRNISLRRISISRNTAASDKLQHYLNVATRRIVRLRSQSEKLIGSDIGYLAHEVENFALPGEIDSIMTTLQNLNIRRNILHKVEDYLHKEATIIMGDQYNVQQAGAVGPHSHAHDMTFNQIWNQTGSDINLQELANELSILRSSLKEEATDLAHDSAIGEVASAEVAAKNGDGPTVLKHLSNGGKWVLDVAEKIGVAVAVAAIKSALGL